MTRQEILSISKPVLFSADMVRAILDGRKTVTRRIEKPQPPKEADGTYERMDNGNFQMKLAPYESIYDYEIKPPYQTGDYLYVRETWALQQGLYWHKAGLIIDADGRDPHGTVAPSKWRPSIHMPKEAARIFLRVTDVRVERLNDITDEDILREGVYKSTNPYMDALDYVYESNPKRWFSNLRYCFFYGLWNSTVKKSDLDKYGWEANPWVWVIEFERVVIEP